jgi:transposase
MTSNLLPDDLWDLIKPHLPHPKKSKKGGRPRVDDRRALLGILVILRFAIPWKALPKELGCGSGSTCRRRLLAWEKRGVWEKVWHLILDTLGRQDGLDLSRVSVDGSYVPAKKGARRLARIPRIAEEKAPNTTSRSMLGAFPLRSHSRRRMFMIPG